MGETDAGQSTADGEDDGGGLTVDWVDLGRLALDLVIAIVAVQTYRKTSKVEAHTNGMQAQIVAFNRKDAGEIGEAKGEAAGRAKQKADDGNA